MVIIIWILIILFVLLVSYQMFLAHFTNDIYYQEGLTTQDSSGQFQSYGATSSSTNPLTLAEQNENNIIYPDNFHSQALLVPRGIDAKTAQEEYLKSVKSDVLDAFLTELYGELTGEGKNQYWVQIGKAKMLA
jgi:hypothetical protein